MNQPVKLGWENNSLYLEVHPPMDEHIVAQNDLLQHTLELIYKKLEQRPATLIGREVTKAVAEKTGIPVKISERSHYPPTRISSPLFD